MTVPDPEPPSLEVTRILGALGAGEREAAAELLPLVYGELRRLAAARMARLAPGQTLQATAVVHEAYLQLVGTTDPGWQGRAHFFGAAARAMRDITSPLELRKSPVLMPPGAIRPDRGRFPNGEIGEAPGKFEGSLQVA